jgi:Tol biopolymer transport system component
MNSDGTVQTRLTNNPSDDMYPSFSPDGTKIFFLSGRDGGLEIYSINIDGSGQINLTNNYADDCAPSFSQDGSAFDMLPCFSSRVL